MKKQLLKDAAETLLKILPENKVVDFQENEAHDEADQVLQFDRFKDEIKIEDLLQEASRLSKKKAFKPRARLLLQLGDQLIKNESIALLELVKNSYDADANIVNVEMYGLDSVHGKIIIEDDGEGMDEDIIWNAWMEPGSDHKEELFRKGKRSKKYKRLPIGEKGIGRFGVHKLGKKIEMVTRKKGGKEIRVFINWEDFEKNKYLDDAGILVETREPESFKGNYHGTIITITGLRGSWTRRLLRSVYRSLFSLVSPFETDDSFSVLFRVDREEWVDDLLDFEKIKDYSLFYFNCELSGDRIRKFIYEFRPWESMAEVSPRKVFYHDPDFYKAKKIPPNQNCDFIQENLQLKGRVPEKRKEERIIDLDNHEIGKIKFEGFIFDLDNNVLELSVHVGKRIIQSYLKEHGGIRIYRDGMRLNEYGESGNDWLNLGTRRVNLPTQRISSNIILSQIQLDRKTSSDLIEKTNREGFVENQAYEDFLSAIIFTIHKIETYRNIDKQSLREAFSPKSVDEPVIVELEELRNLVDKKVTLPDLRNEIFEYIDRIGNQYEAIQDVLLGSAGVGLNLSIGLHEIHKIILELNQVLRKERAPQKVKVLAKRLADLVEGFADMVRQSDKKEESLAKIIDGAIFNNEYRFRVHNIILDKHYKIHEKSFQADCSKRLTLGAIGNIFDNSIHWLSDKASREESIGGHFIKKIFINIEVERDFYFIVIADNGNGFKIPRKMLIKPFISTKNEGMGLGLHLVHEVMKSQGGQLSFPEFGEFEIPDEYQKGAIVALKFKKNKK